MQFQNYSRFLIKFSQYSLAFNLCGTGFTHVWRKMAHAWSSISKRISLTNTKRFSIRTGTSHYIPGPHCKDSSLHVTPNNRSAFEYRSGSLLIVKTIRRVVLFQSINILDINPGLHDIFPGPHLMMRAWRFLFGRFSNSRPSFSHFASIFRIKHKQRSILCFPRDQHEQGFSLIMLQSKSLVLSPIIVMSSRRSWKEEGSRTVTKMRTLPYVQEKCRKFVSNHMQKKSSSTCEIPC